jgi:hypothetical protein
MKELWKDRPSQPKPKNGGMPVRNHATCQEWYLTPRAEGRYLGLLLVILLVYFWLLLVLVYWAEKVFILIYYLKKKNLTNVSSTNLNLN